MDGMKMVEKQFKIESEKTVDALVEIYKMDVDATTKYFASKTANKASAAALGTGVVTGIAGIPLWTSLSSWMFAAERLPLHTQGAGVLLMSALLAAGTTILSFSKLESMFHKGLIRRAEKRQSGNSIANDADFVARQRAAWAGSLTRK